MAVSPYHVYFDWRDFKIHAEPGGSMKPWTYTSLPQTLWRVDATDESDAFRVSVETGRMTKLIEETEESLLRKQDYVARCGNNPYNPTIAVAREEIAQTETRLRHFKELQEIYAPPVIALQDGATPTPEIAVPQLLYA